MADSEPDSEKSDASTFTVSFGGQDRAPENLRFRRAMNQASTFEMTLQAEAPPVDFSAHTELMCVEPDGETDYLFGGFVESAVVERGQTRVRGTNAFVFSESLLGAMNGSGLSTYEKVYSVASIAGLDDENIAIFDTPEPQVERMLVQVPVDGVQLGRVLELGDVRLEPTLASHGSNASATAAFQPLELLDVSVVATCTVSANMLLRAERLGIGKIQAALDALLAANLYSLSKAPDGRPLSFTRGRFRARPRLRPIVRVRSLESERTWVRRVDTTPSPASYEVDELVGHWPELQVTEVPGELRLALSSLRRSADESATYVERNQSLWNAIEFYVAGSKLPKMFSSDALEGIRATLANVELTDAQRKRVEDLVSSLNASSLPARLYACAKRDNVEIDEYEKALLERLRDDRNSASHGRAPTRSGRSDIAHANSIVARLLMFRWVAIHSLARAGTG